MAKKILNQSEKQNLPQHPYNTRAAAKRNNAVVNISQATVASDLAKTAPTISKIAPKKPQAPAKANLAANKKQNSANKNIAPKKNNIISTTAAATIASSAPINPRPAPRIARAPNAIPPFTMFLRSRAAAIRNALLAPQINPRKGNGKLSSRTPILLPKAKSSRTIQRNNNANQGMPSINSHQSATQITNQINPAQIQRLNVSSFFKSYYAQNSSYGPSNINAAFLSSIQNHPQRPEDTEQGPESPRLDPFFRTAGGNHNAHSMLDRARSSSPRPNFNFHQLGNQNPIDYNYPFTRGHSAISNQGPAPLIREKSKFGPKNSQSVNPGPFLSVSSRQNPEQQQQSNVLNNAFFASVQFWNKENSEHSHMNQNPNRNRSSGGQSIPGFNDENAAGTPRSRSRNLSRPSSVQGGQSAFNNPANGPHATEFKTLIFTQECFDQYLKNSQRDQLNQK